MNIRLMYELNSRSLSFASPAGRGVFSTRLGRWFLVSVAGWFPLALPAALQVNFQDLSLDENSFWNGSSGAHGGEGFSSRGARFNNQFTDEFGFDSWSGWAYSTVLDQETPGFGNQYASIAGLGTGANGIYGVAYLDSFTPVFPRIDLPDGHYPVELTVTNTTYAYFAMLEGDGFSKQFSVEDQDWFRLDIRGLDVEGNQTGIVPFYLADFRFESADDAFIIDEWTSVQLSALGEETRSLEFALSSSDVGDFGMNTPAYFVMGDLTAVPEPSSFALLGGIVVGALVIGLRRPRGKDSGFPVRTDRDGS